MYICMHACKVYPLHETGCVIASAEKLTEEKSCVSVFKCATTGRAGWAGSQGMVRAWKGKGKVKARVEQGKSRERQEKGKDKGKGRARARQGGKGKAKTRAEQGQSKNRARAGRGNV
jgi:hypothetical protein